VVSIDLDKIPEEALLKELKTYVPFVSEWGIDLTVSSKHSLDAWIRTIQSHGYKVQSIKPKSGRLEEFFLKSTKK
jgi:hypothetical protein